MSNAPASGCVSAFRKRTIGSRFSWSFGLSTQFKPCVERNAVTELTLSSCYGSTMDPGFEGRIVTIYSLMDRLNMLGLHLEPDADLWRYSQRSVAINSPEAPRLRAWLFSHTYKQVDRKLPRYIAGEERHAGILVPIFEQDGELNLLLTLRSSQLSSHAGQVSFPGGKTDIGENDLDAAVREAEEEVGLAPSQLEVLGILPSIISRKLIVCTPVVAFIDFESFFCKPNPSEVEDVFHVPFSFLKNPKNLKIVPYKGWTSFEWHFKRDSDGKEFRIYGLTGAIILYLLIHAFDYPLKSIDTGIEKLNIYFRNL